MTGHRNKLYWDGTRSKGTEALYYLSHRLHKRGYRRLSRLVKMINVYLFRVYIDAEARIGERLNLPHGGFGTVIVRSATIGDDAIIFHNVTIGMAKPGSITIGDRVYIGTGAVVLGPVTIGDDVRIGAHAVVNFDVPSGATVVSPKASVIKVTPGQNLAGDDGASPDDEATEPSGYSS
jgi:serine O-acetyltransferase